VTPARLTQLRELARSRLAWEGDDWRAYHVLPEALDEIERLRAALECIAQQGVLNSTTAENMRNQARAALEGKP
jgi:hypothetical protein